MNAQQTIRGVEKPGAGEQGEPKPRSKRFMGRSRAPLLLLALGTVVMSLQFAAAQADSVGEYELKAAILYNLVRFVDWPDSAYPDAQAPTVLCILGRDPFGESLTSLVRKQAANGRPVRIRHLENDRAIRDCHVLYISASEKKTLAQIFSTLKGSGILTVGEMSQFAARGGMIQFGLQDKQVRFDINLDAASRAGLKISSRLLVLARIVNAPSSIPGGRDAPIASPGPKAVFSHGSSGRPALEPYSAQADASSKRSDARSGSSWQ